MRQLAPLAIAVPLLTAAMLAFGHAVLNRVLSDLVAGAAALASTVMCLLLTIHVAGGLEVYWFGGWHPRGSLAIGIDLAVDPLGAGLAAFVSLLMVLALLYSARHIEVEHPYYQVLMLVFMAGMVGFCLSGDLFNMFVMFEVMSVAAVALVAYKVHERAALEGGLNFAVINTIGAFLFLLGIGLIYSRTGALNLAQIGGSLGQIRADRVVVIAFALIAAALLVKAAVVPFHFWLADAYAVALSPVCLLLAGAMSEMGIYGLARIYFDAFAPALGHAGVTLRAILISAGLITAGWGAFMALCEDHLKRLLAFVTISFVGVFLCSLALLRSDAVAGAALYVVADGCSKALLFACVGIVQYRHGRVGQRHLFARAGNLRLTAVLFLLGGLSLTGIPPFGSFLGKATIDDAAVKAGFGFLPPLLAVSCGLCAAAVLRAAARVFLGWGRKPRRTDDADDDTEPESGDPTENVPLTMYAATIVLLVGVIGTGVWFGILDPLGSAARRFTDFGRYRSAVYGASVPALPGHLSGPEWYDYAYAALALAVAAAVAAFGLWGPERGASGALRRLASAVVRPLRATHTGRIGDYAAALALGVGMLCGLMAITLT